MKRVFKSRLALSVLILIVVMLGIVFAGDVIVKQGDMDISGDLDVSGGLEIEGYITNSGNYVTVDDTLRSWYGVIASGSMFSFSSLTAVDDIMSLEGKIYSDGGYDPPYVLYDRQTRNQIIERVSREVSPEKQGGAAMFFNAETKMLEVYVASEGAFYDLQGKLLETLPQIAPTTTEYEDMYYLSNLTGEVKIYKKAVKNRFVVKKGYTLDSKTGQFINEKTGETVAKQEAVELQLTNGQVLPIQ